MILTDLQTLFGYLTPVSLTIGVIYHIMTLSLVHAANRKS